MLLKASEAYRKKFDSERWPGNTLILGRLVFEEDEEPAIFMLIWLKFRFRMFIMTLSTRSMKACVDERDVRDCIDGSWSSYFMVLFSLERFCLSIDSSARDIWLLMLESREVENSVS